MFIFQPGMKVVTFQFLSKKAHKPFTNQWIHPLMDVPGKLPAFYPAEPSRRSLVHFKFGFTFTSMPCFKLHCQIEPPTREEILAFIHQQEALPFSYPEVGCSSTSLPPAYDHDDNRVYLGDGRQVFEAGRAAISGWEMFPVSWTRVYPSAGMLAEGVVVAVFFHLFGLWWFNSCRIVYTFNEDRRFGFAYGTLPGHVERGEELFCVEMEQSGEVWYRIRAFSRPGVWLSKLGYPLARRIQKRFVRDSFAAMAKAVRTRLEQNT